MLIKKEDKRLALCLQPSEVRLHPSEKDAYAWLFSNSTSHLFDRQLSDMSTNIYIELSNGLEYRDIQAVHNEAHSSFSSNMRTSIHDLEADTHNLREQLQDSLHCIRELKTTIENYKEREANLLAKNRRLRQAFTIYLRKAHSLGRCLGETGRQVHGFLNSVKLKKGN